MSHTSFVTSAVASDIAPPLQVAQWFNTDSPITLDAMRGKVVVMHAFQMLCPGCVAQGLPQALRVHRGFARSDVVVLGLHTVFEHHDAMSPVALKAFLHEYRVDFPVAVDLPAPDRPIPRTMQIYELRGTPSLIVIDRQGVIRLNHFGHLDDLQLGALLGALLTEAVEPPAIGITAPQGRQEPGCDDFHCAVDLAGATS